MLSEKAGTVLAGADKSIAETKIVGVRFTALGVAEPIRISKQKYKVVVLLRGHTGCPAPDIPLLAYPVFVPYDKENR
jgi:hypothetical protein